MKRIFLQVLLVVVSVILCVASSAADDAAFRKQVQEVLRKTPLIDGHNDLPWQVRDRFKNHLDKIDLKDTGSLNPPMHTDLSRLRAGMVGGQFWSVYVPVDSPGAEAVRTALEQIDVIKRIVERHADILEPAYTAADIQRIHSKGKIASLIGIEGGHCINNSLAVLRQLYVCGARYMTLTHWKSTEWADSGTDDPQHSGLTDFGLQVVGEMNRLGMLVDLSHVSVQTMNEVLDIVETPVIFSHSSVRAISNHARNVPDEVLKRLPSNGGIVMVNFAPSFVSEEVRQYEALKEAELARLKELNLGDPDAVKEQMDAWEKSNPQPPVTLAQVADHIDHIRKLAGIDHVGIGSDLDGISTTPVGLEDVSRFPDLLVELLRRGYSKEDISKVAGLNILRVMKAVELVATRLQRERPPSDALIEELDQKPEMPKE